MFLNDFGALRNVPFCYAWESQPFANSALLNFKRKSDFASYTLQKSIQKQTVLPWVILHYADDALKELCVLPCAFFDPVWQGVSAEKSPISNFEQFFQPFDTAFVNKYGIDSYKAFFPVVMPITGIINGQHQSMKILSSEFLKRNSINC